MYLTVNKEAGLLEAMEAMKALVEAMGVKRQVNLLGRPHRQPQLQADPRAPRVGRCGHFDVHLLIRKFRVSTFIPEAASQTPSLAKRIA